MSLKSITILFGVKPKSANSNAGAIALTASFASSGEMAYLTFLPIIIATSKPTDPRIKSSLRLKEDPSEISKLE